MPNSERLENYEKRWERCLGYQPWPIINDDPVTCKEKLKNVTKKCSVSIGYLWLGFESCTSQVTTRWARLYCHVYGCHYRRGFVLDLLITYPHHWELQLIIALSLIYTLYSSPLQTHSCSQSSLVVSWQRIYKSLTLTAAHIKSFFFHSLIPFLPSLLNHLRLWTPETSQSQSYVVVRRNCLTEKKVKVKLSL
jgi:hypothetical protein